MLNGYLQVFLGGALGWLLVEICKFGLKALYNRRALNIKYYDRVYFAGAVALIFVSGIVAVMNGVDNVPLQRAMQLGMNAPALIAGLGASMKSGKNIGRSMGMDQGSTPTIERKPNLFRRIIMSQSW